MHWQPLLASCATMLMLLVVILMATGRIAGPAKTLGIWSAARPAISRRWLEAAFWGGLAMAVASSAVVLGTASGMLSARWSDVGQMFIWAALAMDAILSRRELWLGLAIAFLAFSGWQAINGFR